MNCPNLLILVLFFYRYVQPISHSNGFKNIVNKLNGKKLCCVHSFSVFTLSIFFCPKINCVRNSYVRFRATHTLNHKFVHTHDKKRYFSKNSLIIGNYVFKMDDVTKKESITNSPTLEHILKLLTQKITIGLMKLI